MTPDVIVGYAEAPTALLERLEEVAEDMRNMRRVAVRTGNATSAVKAADAEIRALNAISSHLGVEDTDLAKTLNQLTAIANATIDASGRDPRVTEAILAALEDRGAMEAAATIRDALASRSHQKEIQ